MRQISAGLVTEEEIKELEKVGSFLKKHKGICEKFLPSGMSTSIDRYIRLAQVFNEFKIPISRKNVVDPSNTIRLSDVEDIHDYSISGELSWPDDGRQPKELLYTLQFPTGAYIFGEEYHRELFVKFFSELKEFGPKYLDSVNNKLLFDSDVAHKVYNALPDILKKYKDMVGEYNKKAEKEKLLKRLAELEG